MAWKESDIVSQRIQFVARLLNGERMTDLCREFGISRKTGYKLRTAYLRYGGSAFDDRSRRPHRSPQQTPGDIVALVVDWRCDHPTWGPKKLRSEIVKKHPGLTIPAVSTIGEILSRKDLVRRRRPRRRGKASPTSLREATAPNQVWCSDFKGQFRERKGHAPSPNPSLVSSVGSCDTQGGPVSATQMNLAGVPQPVVEEIRCESPVGVRNPASSAVSSHRMA
jgi:hypothetical protein